MQKKLARHVEESRQALPKALKELDRVKAELLEQKLEEVQQQMQTEGQMLCNQVKNLPGV
jgi:hypothetical protein